jgi:hypothetical protein
MNIGTDERRRRLAIPAGCIQLALVATALYFGTLQAIAGEPTAQSAGPLVVTPKGDDAVMKMSLDQWTSYLDQRERQKIDEAKEFAPEGLQLPKGPATSNRPLEIWSKAEVKGLSISPGGQGHATGFGAAMNLGRDLKLGVATEHQADGNEEKAINRAGLQARMKYNDWKLLPQATLIDEFTTTHGSDIATGTGSGTHPASSASTRLELTPEIRRSMKLEDGSVLEPFINFTSHIGLDNSGNEETTGDKDIDKVGVGVNFSQPDKYKLEATADFDGLGEGDSSEVKSRVKLTVPLD